MNEIIEKLTKDAGALAEAQTALVRYKVENAMRLERAKRIATRARMEIEAIKAGEAEIEKQITEVSNNIAETLDALDCNDITVPVFSRAARVKRTYAGGSRALIIDEAYRKEPAQLPEEFHKTEIVADTEQIRAALEKGEKLAFARLADRGFKIAVYFNDEEKAK